MAAIPPISFHRITLRWVIYQADIIVIRSAPPHFTEDGTSWCTDATCSGARFLLSINTTADHAPEWADIVLRWKRRAAGMRFFGAPTEDDAAYQAVLRLLD